MQGDCDAWGVANWAGVGTHLQHRVKLHFPVNLMDRELAHEGFARTDRVPGDGLVRCICRKRKGGGDAWKGV